VFSQILEIKLQSWRPHAVIWCLRRCICLTSVANVFRIGVAVASKGAMNERMKMCMSTVERYCIIDLW